MFVQQVKKGISLMACSFLALGLAACSNTDTSNEPISILCPTGAPALSLLGTWDLENVSVEYVDGSDILTSELAKEDGEYDIIVAPTNVGAKVYGESESYNLEAVLTWGNLYLVGQEGTDLSTASIAAFGQNAVPGLVFNQVEDPSLNVTWYSSVQEAQQALLTNQQQVALLAQPVAAATIAKAKENGKELTVLQDLQKLWQEKTNSEDAGYPQASLFVKSGEEEKVEAVLDAVEEYVEEADEKTLTSTIDDIGAEVLGVPNTQIAVKTWNAQNIRYVQGNDAKEDIEDFLAVFHMELPDGLIVE
ncbi:hypothetical protein [uncultured Faecalicoccus sp.]|uniref:hypothetical protein n=1 Tax=uncultured Faecalicoccus sp. TaxID=1971760 RepID=UPI002636AAF8|nr:hypothetical protein [uncultured Faecalicoccus sp.]